MRAITYHRTGDPDVLTLVDKTEPVPGPGEVVVRIHRAGVNPTDWKSRRGSGSGTAVDPPQTPGQDGSGVVVAVGSGVEAALVGLRVWVWEAAYQRPDGTAQELALVPASHVVTLPDSASFDLGASLGVPFVTAHRCLTVSEDGPHRLGPGTLAGRTVLVAGGAGAVGNAAIQLAKWAGAYVITTVSSKEKAELAAAAGADTVINYREEDVAARIKDVSRTGPHVIVEVNASNLDLDLDVVAPNGNIAIYVGGKVTVPSFKAMVKNVSLDFVLTYTTSADEKDAAVAAVAEAVNSGVFRVGEEHGLPIVRFPFERIADAHRAVEENVIGKAVIEIGQP